MSTPDPMAEIRASFFVECEELLEALQDGLQAMSDGTGDSETIHVVFRAVHSIKGGAGAFGLDPIVRFAHRFETLLDAARTGTIDVGPEQLKLFYRAADHLSDEVRTCRDNESAPADFGAELIAELDACLGPNAAGHDADTDIAFEPVSLALDLNMSKLDDVRAAPTYDIVFTPHDDMFESGNDVVPLVRALSDLGTCDVSCDATKVPTLEELAPAASYLTWTMVLTTAVEPAEIASIFEFVEDLSTLSITKRGLDSEAPPDLLNVTGDGAPPAPDLSEADPVPKGAESKPAGPPTASSVVRVDLDRIERLVNLVGELVINQAMLAQSLQSAGLSPHSDAMHGLDEFQRLTRDIQDSVMMIRAQPVKPLFQRMSRIVRETSAAVGKEVRLLTEGDSTEVDKTVIERLADPLTHMIRNAVDHGLETTQDRLAASKPTEGQVRLRAAHRSGRVVIEVSDDGGGIDRPRVQQIAIDKGLIPADSVLTDTEIDNLLFMPGFSTASEVSDLSGRGVGMDVVRTAIQSLGGRISITSERGKGTTFSISMPLTLAVLDGMVVHVAGETLVLPLNVVTETLTLSDSITEEVSSGSHMVRMRDGFVPILDLGHQLGYREAATDFADCVALLITLEDDTRVALTVDEIQDQRQVVIKGLDDSFYRAPGIAAATILGDGQIALILDPSDIIASATPSRVPALHMEA